MIARYLLFFLALLFIQINATQAQVKDTLVFKEFNDDGDRALFFVQKGKKSWPMVLKAKKELSKDLLRGDIIEVLWKAEEIKNIDGDVMEINQVLLDYSKLKDGKVHALRRAYPNLLQYVKSSDLQLTDPYLAYVTAYLEYYLAYSNQPLIKEILKKKDQAKMIYQIDEITFEGRPYMVIGLGTDQDNKQNILQWIYVDNENRKLYEYDIINQRLIEFY
ncbi:hypothetical protein [Sphingobacterium sp.]|uniref:hypothetical protein n=1 Tax=Sphingobacterium sp. TaxID=341027 RepID=UPI0028A9A50F|nr:hypothetical protein [Sphingobacterium sp.]